MIKKSDFGKVITFYSYKGGTGRTMALANVAYLLSQRDDIKKGVLMIDWDLEAPGLHRYFEKYALIEDQKPGLINLFTEFQHILAKRKDSISEKSFQDLMVDMQFRNKFLVPIDFNNLFLLKAGRWDEQYSTLVNTFNWEEFYTNFPEFFSEFANYLARQFDYILIDSRTGLTDIGGICTMIMPEILVAVFTPNKQSIKGVQQLITEAVRYRSQTDDLRTLTVFPLPSRVETEVETLLNLWRFGSDKDGIVGYQTEFENLFKKLHKLELCDLENYFNQAQIQHVPEFSYGEEIAVVTQKTSSRLSLARSYQVFENILFGTPVPWEYMDEGAFVEGEVDVSGGAFVGRDQINIYRGRYEGEIPRTDTEAREIYCQYIAQQAGVLTLRGMDRTESDAGNQRNTLSLAGIYTGLDIQQSTSDKAMATMLAKGQWQETRFDNERDIKVGRELAQDDEDKMRPVSAIEAATLSRKWVLLGDPGSGKTTFVNYLTQILAQKNFENLPAWQEKERSILPVVIILRNFYRWAQSKGESRANSNLLRKFILHDLTNKDLIFANVLIENALEAGQAILILDGLDEVPPGEARTFVRDSILAFHSRYVKNRFLITCRVLSYQNEKWQLPKEYFPSFQLVPFNNEKIAEFIKAWYSEVAQKWNVPEAHTTSLAKRLLNAVQRVDLARLAQNPLLLTVMALIHTEYGELPNSRAQLYQQAVDVLLWRWEQEKSKEHGGLSQMIALLQEAGRDRNDLLLVLGQLAFEAHRRGGNMDVPEAVSGISQSELLATFRELHPMRSLDWAEAILDTMRLRSGLLIDRDGTVFTFPDRSFQEYLAATHLAKMPDFPTQAKILVETGSLWREVVLLAVGHLAHNTLNRSMPLMLAAELCPEQLTGKSDWQEVVLSGEVLLEVGINRVSDSQTGKAILHRVQLHLGEIIEKDLLAPNFIVRAKGVLAQLGGSQR